jgi:hypothetical protein
VDGVSTLAGEWCQFGAVFVAARPAWCFGANPHLDLCPPRSCEHAVFSRPFNLCLNFDLAYLVHLEPAIADTIMDLSKLSIEEVLELAKLRIDQKKVKEAQDILNDTYGRLESTPLDLLNCLVSVSLKLGDVALAMVYAVEMTQNFPTSALV